MPMSARCSRDDREGFTPILVPSDDVLEEYLGILKDDGYILEDTLKDRTGVR